MIMTTIETCLRDMRHGWLAMTRRRRFAATVIATIAVGIAANTSIVALVHAALLRPLPYPDADRLVAVREIRADSAQAAGRTSPARLEDWRALNHTLDAIGGAYMDTFTLTTTALPTRLSGAVVSPGFFETLRTAPISGRVFTADEERAGGPTAVVISERLWKQMTGQPEAIRLGAVTYTVVGVMPATFAFPSPLTDVWVPKQASAGLMRVRQARNFDVVGRLKPGVTPEQAAADFTTIQRQLGEQYPRTDAQVIVSTPRLKDRIVGDTANTLWLVFGTGLLILLVTCANVGCLLLAQAPARLGEMRTRAALGASRVDILRQLVAEASAYAIAGGSVGLGVAAVSLPIIRAQLATTPRIGELQMDVVIGVVVGLQVVLATMLFALAPAARLAPRLTPSGRGVIGGGTRTIRGLVIAQLSVATVLLIGAGLLARSFVRLQHVPLGVSPDRLLTFRVSASFSDGDPAQIAMRQMRVLDAVSRVPGIERVAAAAVLPGLDSGGGPEEFIVKGAGAGATDAASSAAATGTGTRPFALVRAVSSDYFGTLGVRVLAGATCPSELESLAQSSAPPSASATTATAMPAANAAAAPAPTATPAVVNRRFVDTSFRGVDSIGRQLVPARRPTNPPLAIVGVVDDVREQGNAGGVEPTVYVCGTMRFFADPPYLARTAADPAQFAAAVRAAVKSVEPSRAVYEIVPLTDVLAASLATPRFQASLVGLFAAIAMLLAAVGLYGVLSYTVALRRHEIGVRLALGAQPARVTREVIAASLANAAAGVLIGVIAAAALVAPLLSRVLFGVSTRDVPTYLAVAACVATVSVLAAVVPAWRAGTLQPTEALRLE